MEKYIVEEIDHIIQAAGKAVWLAEMKHEVLIKNKGLFQELHRMIRHTECWCRNEGGTAKVDFIKKVCCSRGLEGFENEVSFLLGQYGCYPEHLEFKFLVNFFVLLSVNPNVLQRVRHCVGRGYQEDQGLRSSLYHEIGLSTPIRTA